MNSNHSDTVAEIQSARDKRDRRSNYLSKDIFDVLIHMQKMHTAMERLRQHRKLPPEMIITIEAVTDYSAAHLAQIKTQLDLLYKEARE